MPGVTSEAARETATFAFGEKRLVFESIDKDWLGYLDRRYGAFRTEPAAEPAFVVSFEPDGPAPPALVTPLAAYLEPLRWHRTPDGFHLATDTSSCDVDWAARRARLRGPTAMYPLDNLLRHLLPLVFEEGILLHSALLRSTEGDGLVACGPSGAGKSTLAELASEHALCDELSAVELDQEGVTATALPYWQSRPGRAPLRALLFLRQGSRHRAEPLPREKALRRLATQVLWPVWDEGAMKRSFAHTTSLLERVPAFELTFARRADVWEFLEKEVL
jgi:hypothetical protein